MLWEKWIFKGDLNEQGKAHGHKDPLFSCVEEKGTTRDESSLSCLIFFEGLTQTFPCDTMADGLGSVMGANLYEFVCATGRPEVTQPRLGVLLTGLLGDDELKIESFLFSFLVSGFKSVPPPCFVVPCCFLHRLALCLLPWSLSQGLWGNHGLQWHQTFLLSPEYPEGSRR